MEVSTRDTVEIILADEHGKWQGKGAASVFTLYYPYQTNIRFPLRGIYTFDIEQAMWIKDLKHISDIGLRIEKAGQIDDKSRFNPFSIMVKKKLQRFAEMETFSNVIQPAFDEVFGKDYHLKGNWNTAHFLEMTIPLYLNWVVEKENIQSDLPGGFPKRILSELILRDHGFGGEPGQPLQENLRKCQISAYPY